MLLFGEAEGMLCKQCSFESTGTEQFCPNCGVALVKTQQPQDQDTPVLLPPGFILDGRFRIGEIYAKGTSNLYEASCIATGQSVLIEELALSRETRDLRESESMESAVETKGYSHQQLSDNNNSATLSLREKFDLLQAINYPVCPKVIDYIALEGKEYLVFEPWHSKSLTSLISRNKIIENEALDIAVKLCQCVEEIHRHGYLQLNIEPNNIYISDGQVSLFDFSRALKQGDMRLNYLTTDGFSAPELMLPEGAVIDARTDIYSIGAVLFWMLSGKKLKLAGITPGKMASMLSSPGLARILLPCISVDINQRYGTAAELQEKLQSYQAAKEKTLHYDSASLSDMGMVRENNEDACFVMEYFKSADSQIDSYGIYLVADGMGGHAAGEIASSKAVGTISSFIINALKSRDKSVSCPELVKQAIEKANKEIFNMTQAKASLASAGTTITLGLRVNNHLYLGHVGDSRCYLIRGGKIDQLTRDHSVVGDLLRRGKITIEQAKNHPDRGKIYRCLGSAATVSIDTLENAGRSDSLALQNGDRLVFCTDGLINDVSDDDIMELVGKGADATSICHSLVHLANARGGDDNITVIVVKVI